MAMASMAFCGVNTVTFQNRGRYNRL